MIYFSFPVCISSSFTISDFPLELNLLHLIMISCGSCPWDRGTRADPGFSKGGGGEHQDNKILKIWVSKMAISCILRQISYSFNTNFFLVNFAFVKKKCKKGRHSPPWIRHWGMCIIQHWSYTRPSNLTPAYPSSVA